MEIGVMLGLHVVGVGVARSTTWMYNRARNARAVVAHGVPSYGGGKIHGNTLHSAQFNSKADPLLKSMGDARVSHPEEYAAILQDLKKHGVEIIRTEKTIAFAPSANGKVGNQIHLPEEFSISALRHGYGHFLDHKALGYPRMAEYAKNPQFWLGTERRQYLQELQFAKEMNDPQARKILMENYLAEKEYLMSRYYQKPYGEYDRIFRKMD